MFSSPSPPPPSGNGPLTLNILSLNCWGLKYISSHRLSRLTEIAHRIALATPSFDIVALQEFWVYSDYLLLRKITSEVLPYGKYYHSGVLGGGLVVLGRWPIVESTMHGYKLNGRPTAFWRGDWYVGKGVAEAVIEVGETVLDVFTTHLHAPYEKGDDSYLCHRTAQAWQLAKLLRGSVQKGHVPIALGDFNMIPSSLAHYIITTHGLVSDSWLSRYPNTPPHPNTTAVTLSTPPQQASYNLHTLGTTCDSVLNTWGMPPDVIDIPSPDTPDPRAQRLDYIFHPPRVSTVLEVKVGMTQPFKLPGVHKPRKGIAQGGLVSLSDHFSVEVKLQIHPPPNTIPPLINLGDHDHRLHKSSHGHIHNEQHLSPQILDEIQLLTTTYFSREKWEYTWRIAHFWVSVLFLIGLHIVVWWGASYHVGVAFMCTVLAWIVAVTGTVNGLIGFLFMGSEMNALSEFEEEIRIYRRLVEGKAKVGPRGGQGVEGAEVGESRERERVGVDDGRVVQ